LYFTILPFPAWATDYFVKTPANGGNNANSGLDWANAKATIGAAMETVNGDDNIKVAAGTYNEKIVFPGYNNIALRGGYASSGGDVQNPVDNPPSLTDRRLHFSGNDLRAHTVKRYKRVFRHRH